MDTLLTRFSKFFSEQAAWAVLSCVAIILVIGWCDTPGWKFRSISTYLKAGLRGAIVRLMVVALVCLPAWLLEHHFTWHNDYAFLAGLVISVAGIAVIFFVVYRKDKAALEQQEAEKLNADLHSVSNKST